jgi:predicted RNase H-like nuclease (RuvC/YqgF family)
LKIEEQYVKISTLESDYFKQGQELRELKEKNENLKYQIISVKSNMSMKEAEFKTFDDTEKKLQQYEKDNSLLEKRIKELIAEKNFLKKDLE